MRNQKDQGVVSSLIIFGLLIMIILATCSGCTSVPVSPKFPEVPKELLAACPDLKTVDTKNDKLSTIVDTVADNYREYYECKDKVNDWATWYTRQQELWKTLK